MKCFRLRTKRSYELSAFLKKTRCILFDWGDTIMRDFPEFIGPMIMWPKVEALPDVREVLEELGSSWTLCLATNAADSTEELIWRALERVCLKGSFDKVYCAKNVGHRKPTPEFYIHILTDLCVRKESAIMVGDNFDTDVLGANKNGIRGIWLNEKTTEKRNGAMYKTIHELRALPSEVVGFLDSIEK